MPTRSIAVILACAALCSGVSSVRADEKSHRAAVLELCDVMHMERSLQESMKGMIDLQIQQAPELARARPQLQQFFDKYLSWASLKEDFVKLYQETFSEPELRQLITFYKTPTGQKAVAQMPTLMQRGAQLGANRMREHTGELLELMQSVATTGPRATSPKPVQPAPAPSAPAGAVR